MGHLPAESAQSSRRTLRFSSDDYPPLEVSAALREVFQKRIHEVVLDPAPVGYPYRVRLELHTLGPITVNFGESNWTQISRPRALIARSRRDPFVLLQPRTGMASFRLPHGEVTARPRECLFVDTGKPHEFLVREPTTTVGLTLPREWLARWLPRPEHSPNLFAPNDSGWGAALCALVGSLQPATIDSLALPATSVAENIASLIALAAGPESQTPRPSLLSLLRATLWECLHEPTLSAGRLADRHDISLRSLHYAFANEGTSFREELMRMRLQRAHELLNDATLAHLGVAEIAGECGFADPSHFARRFRQQFGMAPLQYRRNRSSLTSGAALQRVPGRTE